MRRNTWMVKLAAGLGSLLLIGGLCACSTQEEETSSLVSQVEDLSLFPEGASIGGEKTLRAKPWTRPWKSPGPPLTRP